MLIWMREGAGGKVVKVLLLGLMTMAVAGLVLMDVGGFFRSDLTSGTIAKGPDIKISSIEFDRTVRRILSQQGIPPEEAYRLGLINRILEGEVQARLFRTQAYEYGLHVSDDDVAAQISKIAAPLTVGGQSKKEALQQVLRQQGMGEGEFVNGVRGEMTAGLLRDALDAPETLSSPALAANLYRFDQEKRTVKYVVLNNDTVKDLTKPSDEQLQGFYNANKIDYLIPGSRKVTVATLKSDMLKNNKSFTDEELRAEYDRNIAQFTKPPQRTLEQAIFKTELEAKAAADAMKSGKSLKESAGGSYIGQDDFQENGLLPEVADPVFDAKQGDIVGPVKTSLGWHVLLVKALLPERTTPFEQVKAKLAEEMKNISASDDMFEAANTIEDRIAAGDSLDVIVKDYGMTTEVLGPFHSNGMNAGGKDLFASYGTDKDKLVQTAYDYEQGEITNIVETADGQFHVMRIDDVVPDAYRDFASVRSEIEKRWVDLQQRELNEAKTKTLLAALNDNISLEDAARQNGLTIRTASDIARVKTPPAPITPLAAAQIFVVKQGQPFSAEIDDGYIVGMVTDVTMPDAAPANSKEVAELNDIIGRSLSQDLLGEYVGGLTKGKDIQINAFQLKTLYEGTAQANTPSP